MHFGKTRISLAYCVLFTLVPLVSGCYRHSEFKGGLTIIDRGVFSYPRYYAEVGRFPLKDGENTYTLTGLPPEQLTLELFVKNGSEAQRAQLTSLPARAMVSIIDASGNTVCKSDGNLAKSNGVDDHVWVLATSASAAYYWDSDCRDIPVRRHKMYTIAVHISETEPQSPLYEVTLTLVGGGIELP